MGALEKLLTNDLGAAILAAGVALACGTLPAVVDMSEVAIGQARAINFAATAFCVAAFGRYTLARRKKADK